MLATSYIARVTYIYLFDLSLIIKGTHEKAASPQAYREGWLGKREEYRKQLAP
jgi:hypothetical protein